MTLYKSILICTDNKCREICNSGTNTVRYLYSTLQKTVIPIENEASEK